VAEHVPTTSITIENDPSPIRRMTNPDHGEAAVEGEVVLRREPPRRVQVDHPALRIIGDMNERTTRSEQFSFHSYCFCCTFEPKDIGHALSYHNWVNLMHEELENFERNQVWVLVDPPPGVSRLGQNGCGRTNRERKEKWRERS
jgi:hypothetical protein